MAQLTDTQDATPPQPPRARPGLLALFVTVFLACCIGTTMLPHARYLRYQQFDGTIMKPLAWMYERLHYDPTPVDVAIIGASRTEIGISGPQVQAILSARLGWPMHVVNLSMPEDGRDLHYALTRELLATHPEVKLILYSLVEHASRTGHPGYRHIADTSDVLRAPMLLNPGYFENVAFQPYRGLALFVQTLAPGLFGVRRTFDPGQYLGTDHDTTLSHWSVHGNWVDRDSIRSAVDLATAAKGKLSLRNPVFLPARYRDYEYAIERHYTRAAVDLARRRGVQVGFVYLPTYAYDVPIADLPFYRARGFIMNAGVIAGDARNYSDYAHLNRHGSQRVSRWIAGWLATLAQRGQLHLSASDRAH